MNTSTQIQPISYLKANAAAVLRDLALHQNPVVITQNGEAAAVLQDIDSFEKNQETMALLKILALGNAQVEQGKVLGVDEAFAKVRKIVQEKRTRAG
jgi:prevent-host-death family protein